jgi:hypothetical protein
MKQYSRDSYRLLLSDAIAEGYRFGLFHETADTGEERVLYLRHDVDFSLAMAVELARINAQLGVTGTFFILLRGPAYNAATRRSQERLAELLTLGQRIAFHWAAPHEVPADHDALANHVRAEFELASRIIPELDPVFAVHSPDGKLMRRCVELDCPPLVNANGNLFSRRMPYYADSNLRYSVETWRALIRRGEPSLHVLLHPVNWIAGGGDMFEVLRNTWPYLISEMEEEMRLNRAWAAAFVDGMPERVRTEFSTALARVALET